MLDVVVLVSFSNKPRKESVAFPVIEHVPGGTGLFRPHRGQQLLRLTPVHSVNMIQSTTFSSHPLSWCDFTVLGCFLHRSCTRPTLRSCSPTSWLSSSSTKSFYCHSFTFTEISTEIPCSLIISPWRSHLATRVTMLEGIMDCHRDFIRPEPGSFQTFIPAYLLHSFPDFCKVFVKILRLCVIALHHLPNFVTDILWSFRFLIKGVHFNPRFPDASFVRFPRLWHAPHPHFSALRPAVHGARILLLPLRNCINFS